MVCLPGKDPNQYDLFDPNINFDAEPSTVYPPNMQDIMAELAKPDAFTPSPNLAILDDIETALLSVDPNNGATADDVAMLNGTFNFANDSRFDPYTETYQIGLPPLLPNTTGGIQDIIDAMRTHLYGIPSTVPGAVGSLGGANMMRNFGYVSQGNALQRNLGLGAIPDCGLIDALLGLLREALQPLIDLLAELLKPIIEILAYILAILAAILAELLKLLKLAQDIVNFLNAARMLSLDPCALLYLAEGGSEGLKKAVNEGIKWKAPDLPTIPDVGSPTLPPPPPI